MELKRERSRSPPNPGFTVEQEYSSDQSPAIVLLKSNIEFTGAAQILVVEG